MIIIKISGETCSGKTQLAGFLQERLEAFYSWKGAVVDGTLFEWEDSFKPKLDKILNYASTDTEHQFLIITICTTAPFNIEITSGESSRSPLTVFAALGGSDWWAKH